MAKQKTVANFGERNSVLHKDKSVLSAHKISAWLRRIEGADHIKAWISRAERGSLGSKHSKGTFLLCSV